VFYYIERVGECASRLRRDFDYDNKYTEIDWHGTVLMRRHLVHVYWKADPDLVWQGVQYLLKVKEKLDVWLEAKELELEKAKAKKTGQAQRR